MREGLIVNKQRIVAFSVLGGIILFFGCLFGGIIVIMNAMNSEQATKQELTFEKNRTSWANIVNGKYQKELKVDPSGDACRVVYNKADNSIVLELTDTEISKGTQGDYAEFVKLAKDKERETKLFADTTFKVTDLKHTQTFLTIKHGKLAKA